MADAKNIGEAIALAGLDWTVEQAELDAPNAPVSIDLSEFRTNYYVNSDGDPITLGIVGSTYGVIQNAEMMAPLDYIRAEFDAIYIDAGALSKGRVPYVRMRVPSLDRTVNGDDIQGFIVGKTSHDGSGALTIAHRPTVQICTNGMRGAFKTGQTSVSVRHTSRAEVARDLGAQLMRSAEEQMDLIEQYGSRLNRGMSAKKFRETVHAVFGDPAEEGIHGQTRAAREQAEERVMIALDVTRQVPLDGLTAWDAFQAITEADEWLRPIRTKDNPAEVAAKRTLEGANDARVAGIREKFDAAVLVGA